jgi:hypothetical protein
MVNMTKATKAAKVTKVTMVTKNHTPLFDRTASGASVDTTSQVSSSAILLLPMARNLNGRF